MSSTAVVTSHPSSYNLKCPREVIDCLVRNNASVLKVIRTPFYQKNRRVDIVVSRQADTLTYSGHPVVVRAAMRVTFNELRKHNIIFLQLKELAQSLDVQVNGMRRTQSPVQQQPVSRDDFEVLKRSSSQENVGGHQEFTRQRSATFSHIQRSKRGENQQQQHQQSVQHNQHQQQQHQQSVQHQHQQQQQQQQMMNQHQFQQQQQKIQQQQLQQLQHQQQIQQQHQQRLQQQQQQQQQQRLQQQQQQQQLMKQATPKAGRRSEPIMSQGSVDINPRQLQTMISTKQTVSTSNMAVRPAGPHVQHRQQHQGQPVQPQHHQHGAPVQPHQPQQVRHIPVTVQQQRSGVHHTSDDNISLRSVQTQERPASASRLRAVSIENLHKSPGRAMTSQLTREDSLRSQQSVGPRRSRKDMKEDHQQLNGDTDILAARLVKLEKQRDDLEFQNSKAHDALEELEDKKDKLERVLREERENSKNRLQQVEAKKDDLQSSNYQMQQLIKTMREKMEALEKEKDDLQVNCAVLKAEKHNAISALETVKHKQQNVTEEISHLYKLNSEQAVKITEFEKEKKLNTEEFAFLYKTKNDQAEKLKEFEKQEKDLSQFHKTISDQAIKISDLEKTNSLNIERLSLFSEHELKIKELENNKAEKSKELKTLDNTILEQATNVSNLEREIKGKDDEILRLNQQKMDQNVKITELQKEIEKLRKLVSDQSTKLNQAENGKKEIVQPKKEIFQDLSRLKDHYQDTINSLKAKYEETKILLSLRDQELAILRRRSHKQSLMELDSETRKDSVESIDTVDENDVE